MFLCGRKEEFSRTATSSKTGKTKNKQTKKNPKEEHNFEAETSPGIQTLIPQVGSQQDRSSTGTAHTHKLGYTYPSLGNTERNLVSHS